MIKDKIINFLKELTKEESVNLEFPENNKFGDYSSNLALIIAKKQGKKPHLLAEEIVEKLQKNKEINDLFEKIEVAGSGFINFYLSKEVLFDNLDNTLKKGKSFGESNLLKGKKIVFEFAHPNTHKAFHIGHLRNIVTGEALSRLYEAVGADVTRVNYQGDIGLHIAKAIWGIMDLGFEDLKDIDKKAKYLGKIYAHGASRYEEDEKINLEIHAINKKLYDKSDPEINNLYSKTRKWSLDYFEKIYKRVYTKFDRLYFESECFQKGKEIALKALENDILEKSEGAIIFKGSKYKLHDRVFISSEDIPTYEAKDLGLAALQFEEFNPDLLIHVVGSEQTDYFKVVFKALELIQPETKGRESHVVYGWVKLKDGKMSSRMGNVVLGEDILDTAKENIIKSYKTKEVLAEEIAVGALKYSFLKNRLDQEIAFDLKESISLDGNSGPYLQYTQARINSVISKAKMGTNLKLNMNELKLNDVEKEILTKLNQYEKIVQIAATDFAPSILCTYLFNLASKFNSFYNRYSILKNDNESVTDFRLVLTKVVGQVLRNGLNILGIQAPEKM